MVDLVRAFYKYSPVSLSESVAASKTLAEYLHAKRKQVEITNGDGNSNGSNTPLTEEEIILFREKFNDDF